MRIVRTFGLAAIAMLGLLAIFGASSAGAAGTVFCKVSTELPSCKASNQYPAGTALKASTSKLTIESAAGPMSCGSTLEGVIEGASDPLLVKGVEWTLTGCKLGSTSCTATNTKSALGGISRSALANGNGEFVDWEGPAWHVTCGETVDCNYAFARMKIEGSITGTNIKMTRSGVKCPLNVTMTGTLTPSSPSNPLVLAQPINTMMCKALESFCQSGNSYGYPSGTAIEGKSSNFVVHTGGSYPTGDINCSTATIVGQTTAWYGEPLGAKLTGIFPSGCKSSSGLNCEMSYVSSSSAGISKVGTDGIWTISSSWKLSCGAQQLCTFSMTNAGAKIEHGTPGVVRLSNSPSKSGELCPTGSVEIAADFPLTSPSGSLYFTDYRGY